MHLVSKIPPHSHTFSEDWKYDNVNHWHEATCEHTDAKGNEAAHDLVSVEAKEPTCTEVGWDAYQKCSVCGYTTTYTEKPATGHSFSEDWTKDATYHWHAATCEHTSEVSGKAEHDWDDGKQTTAPGYDTAGVMTYTCNTCGQTKTESIATLPAKDNTVTYTGSTSKDYDGNVIALESDKITRSGDGAITFMYKESTEEDSAYTATAPKNAGTYNVKISVAKTAEWKAAELVVEYTINKVVLPLQTLTMTYEVLPQPTGTGIGTYKSKTFTSVDGLPEGVTIKVYPYNKAENGTFTVSSSGSTTYNIGAGSDNIEEFRTALYAAASNLEANQFIARISLGPNYTLPEDRGVATLKVTPKEITGDFTFSRVYDGTNTFRIDGADLLDYGIYEADKDDVYLLLRLNSKDAESKKIQTASLLKKVDSKKNYNYKVADEANFNVTITKKDISGLVYDLVIPILKDSSGNVIKTRTLEVGSRYGTTQKDTDITLKFEGDYDWETSAVFYNKKTNPEASVYFTMKGTAINNYELDNVQLILKNSVTDSAVKEGTLGQTYIVQAPKNVTLSNARYYKYTVVQGKTYLITLNANDNYRYTVSDEKGYIYCPDNDNKFTAQRSGELYLWIYHNDIARAYNFTLSEV